MQVFFTFWGDHHNNSITLLVYFAIYFLEVSYTPRNVVAVDNC